MSKWVSHDGGERANLALSQKYPFLPAGMRRVGPNENLF
jgi:hypothetical protein